MWFVLWSAIAQGQVTDGAIPAIDAQLFRPSLDSQYTLWTNDSTKFENHALMGRFMVHYAKDPLVYRFDNDDPTLRVLSDVLQFDAAAGYQLGPVRMGLVLPIYAYTDGENRASSAGFGDLTVDLKGTVLERTDGPVGVAFGGRLGLPTAAIDNAPLGSNGVSWELEAIVDKDLGKKTFLAANLGYRGIPDVQLENLEWQDSLFGKIGLGYKTSDVSGLSAEIVSHAVSFSEPAGVPAEILLGGWGRAATGLKLRGGLGTSLSQGVGAPLFRAMFALSFEPNTDPDTDGDGIVDPLDDCKEIPEDLDGVEDTDGCPEATVVTMKASDPDGKAIEGAMFSLKGKADATAKAGETVDLFGGEYTAEVTADGFKPLSKSVSVPDAETYEIAVTLEKEIAMGTLRVNVTDPDGEPIEGANWATIGALKTKQPGGDVIAVPAMSYSLRVFAPGHRTRTVDTTVEDGGDRVLTVELAPAMAELEGEQITIKDSVYFETAKADIKAESFPLLTEIAEILRDHPEITKLRIEGHTDSRGSAPSNKTLSESRAASVKNFLIEKGVSADRLESAGFGEEKPLDPADNRAAWTKNRRVDFFVAGRR